MRATADRTGRAPSKGDRSARHQAARVAAARRRQEAQRRRQLILAGAAVALVMVVLGTLVVVRLSIGAQTVGPGPASGPAAPELTRAATGVPIAVLDTVGAGTVNAVPRPMAGQPPLTAGAKPVVLYVGAEFCPFCAAQRWGMVVALSRFGTFSGLGSTHSASDDAYPDTATLSFHGTSYTSEYLAFQGIETQTNVRQAGNYSPLDSLTAQQSQILRTYNATPYVDPGSAGAIPFVDFGNRYVMVGASLSPQLLAGLTAAEIATALADPNSPVAKAVDGSANVFSAALCELTGGQPATVCTGPAVLAGQTRLHAAT